MGNVTSFKVGGVEFIDPTRFALLGETLYLLSAAPPYEEVMVDVAGRYPAYQRRQMQARESTVTIALLRGDALLRRMDFDQIIAAFQPTTDYQLASIRWVESGVIRKVYCFAKEIVPGPWYSRAAVSLVIPNPVAYVSYPGQVALTAGLTAHYRLGEASGAVMTDRLGAQTGSYTGSPTLGVTGALAGDPDTAATFSGTGQYGRSTSTFASGVTEMSLAAWFKTSDATAARRTLMAHAANGNPYNASLTKESGTPTKLTMRVLNAPTDSTAITSATSARVINDNTWHHAVGVIKKGEGVWLYIDGAEDAAAAHPLTTWSPGAGYAQIGQMNTAELWLGSIDEPAFYNRALTADEVSYLYAAGITTL
jgi:hypothetical protein